MSKRWEGGPPRGGALIDGCLGQKTSSPEPIEGSSDPHPTLV